ncbi:AAA family ATPase [Streptomyces hydrogenans]|uniref:AAA family ATPase n=1 Tax=Streptomyces hydrogenans TaxID=1873719 RepID=UPI0036383951
MNPQATCVRCEEPTHPGARFCAACGAPLTLRPTEREGRRDVTVLFVDLVGSTALAERLDPEPLRRLLDRYYAHCVAVVAEHGGVVEKFIGDAVMAIFGVPVNHEDDALRAVSAAQSILAAVAELGAEPQWALARGLSAHAGVATGEAVVVTRTGADARVVGDVVNTAARLQSAAVSGQLLVAAETADLVRSRVRLSSVPALSLKGKTGLVPAWSVSPGRPLAAPVEPLPLVGRGHELSALTAALAEVKAERSARVVTLTGEAGIGKTRLLREFAEHASRLGVPVVSGGCPSFGAGITYRPLTEMLEDPGLAPVLRTLADTPDGPRAVRHLATLRAGGSGVSVEEATWAVWRLVETATLRRPLVLVFDSLHWARPTLLSLIDDIAERSARASVLLLRVARAEPAPLPRTGRAAGLHLELAPLTRDQVGRLVDHALHRVEVLAQEATDLREQVVDACDGNPLYAELVVEQLVQNRRLGRTRGSTGVPPTVRALIGARLDRLPASDRAMLERISVLGPRFTVDRLRHLTDADGTAAGDGPGESVTAAAERLARQGWIRCGARSDEYRFDQPLVRELVYALARKEDRARWHLAMVRFSDDEEAGHLEPAFLLRRDIEPGSPALAGLGRRAARALIRQGTSALHRKDLSGSIDLLARGRALLPPGAPEHRETAVRLCDAHTLLGDVDAAQETVRYAARHATDPATDDLCAVQQGILRLRLGREGTSEAPAPGTDDPLAWCRYHQYRALRLLQRGRTGAAETALREALDRARAVPDRYEEDRLLGAVCELTQWSPTPVAVATALCDEYLDRMADDRALLVPVLAARARLRALRGDLDGSRADLVAAAGHVDALRLTLAGATVDQAAGVLESLAGDHEAARRHFERGAATLRRHGHGGSATTLAAYAARALLRGGDTEAAAAAVRGLTHRSADQYARLTIALVRAGLTGSARIARAAVRRLGDSDDPCLVGEVRFVAARVCGDPTEARRALAAYTAKGAELPARTVREWLEAHE